MWFTWVDTRQTLVGPGEELVFKPTPYPIPCSLTYQSSYPARFNTPQKESASKPYSTPTMASCGLTCRARTPSRSPCLVGLVVATPCSDVAVTSSRFALQRGSSRPAAVPKLLSAFLLTIIIRMVLNQFGIHLDLFPNLLTPPTLVYTIQTRSGLKRNFTALPRLILN